MQFSTHRGWNIADMPTENVQRLCLPLPKRRKVNESSNIRDQSLDTKKGRACVAGQNEKDVRSKDTPRQRGWHQLGNEAGEQAFGEELRQFIASGAALKAAGVVEKEDEHGGVGLFAARPLPRGFELTIPTKWVLDGASASASVLGRAVRNSGLSQEETLLVVLADARPSQCGHAAGISATCSISPWAAYGNILPKVAPDPGSWPLADRQALLAGTDLGAALVEAERDLVALHTRVAAAAAAAAAAGSGLKCRSGHRMLLSLDDLRWARGMLLSRRFAALAQTRSGAGAAVLPGLWGEVGSLVPLFDVLNHDAGARVETRGFEGSLGVTVGARSCTTAQWAKPDDITAVEPAVGEPDDGCVVSGL
jgi:hypothetical protein